MKTEKLGQEPAFPNESTMFCQPPDCYGMSKRFYAACCAMQGILANEVIMNVIGESNEQPQTLAVRMAYSFADELLKQESE